MGENGCDLGPLASGKNGGRSKQRSARDSWPCKCGDYYPGLWMQGSRETMRILRMFVSRPIPKSALH